jgi:hypothetical protein
LPEAATITTLLSEASATALLRTLDVPSTPRLMVMMCAPWSTAQCMPLATVESVPSPLSFITLTAIRRTWLMPATPMPLFMAAPTTPATCVP